MIVHDKIFALVSYTALINQISHRHHHHVVLGFNVPQSRSLLSTLPAGSMRTKYYKDVKSSSRSNIVLRDTFTTTSPLVDDDETTTTTTTKKIESLPNDDNVKIKNFNDDDVRTWDAKFAPDESIEFWSDFKRMENRDDNLRRLRTIVDRYVSPGAVVRSSLTSSEEEDRSLRLAYWFSHVLRSGYFCGNAVLGTLFSEVSKRFESDGERSNEQPTFAMALLSSDITMSGLLLETFCTYEQDWKNIRDGVYNFPWDAAVGPTTGERTNDGGTAVRLRSHRQLNPFFSLSETRKVIRESMNIISRRSQFVGKPYAAQTLRERFQSSSGSSSSDISYPDYYLNDFHYQTDGWMSSASAQLYETSTETLFLGRQDAMQRATTLPPLVRHFQNYDVKKQKLRFLEVACGTGRLSTFVRDQFPHADVTLTDLSPYYLEKARDNDDYWMTTHAKRSTTTTTTTATPATIVQANAEALPFADDSFDAITCVYLFHELPPSARAAAAKEMARVVTPGGIVVLTDSFQRGDRPELDDAMVNFKNLNEPYYESFVGADLGALFVEAGLRPGRKFMASSTKSLSFVKMMDG